MGLQSRLIHLLKWAVALGLASALLFVVYRVHEAAEAERASESEEDKLQTARRARDGIVILDAESIARYALATAPAEAVEWRPSTIVYGQVVPNPHATVEIRSPAASILRAADDGDWPIPGRQVRNGRLLGWVDIRVGPQERLTLRDNLNSSRLRKAGAEQVVQLRKRRVERLEKVTGSEILPRQQLDDARVLLAEAEMQLAVADAAVKLWEKAEAELDQPNSHKSFYSLPLLAPSDGEITELAARPGAAIEAGGLVATLVDFRRPLVRLDIPPTLLAGGAPASVELFAISVASSPLSGIGSGGDEQHGHTPVSASLVGPAPQVDAASQLVGYWYAVDSASSQRASLREVPASAIWRPGLKVKASVSPPLAPLSEAIAVPESAVLYHLGRALVYVALDSNRFERREVRLLGREGDRWIVAPSAGGRQSVAAGEPVVCREAQVLLSEEFRSDEGGDD